MGQQSITRKDDGSECIPGRDLPWTDWVAATETRNYCKADPLLDWLDLYGDNRGFTPDYKQFGYDPRTDYTRFILGKGKDFQTTVLAHLSKQLQVVTISTGPETALDLACAEATWNALSDGVEVVSGGVLWNPQNQTFGIADLIVRSDVLNRLFPGTLTSNEESEMAPDIPNARWHYRIIEIKYKKLKLCKDGHFTTEAASLALVVQSCMYNEMLGRLQGYRPGAAYLLGRCCELDGTKGVGALERLAYVNSQYPALNKKRPLSDVILHACQWIRRLRSEGANWQVLPNPTVDELRPHMGNDEDYPWHSAKTLIANQLQDLTLLPRVGPEMRNLAVQQGVLNWDDPRCTASYLGVGGQKNGPQVDQVIAINRGDNSAATILPRRITMNETMWRKPSQFEFYVDFENVSNVDDDFSSFPNQGGCPMTFMIGCGHLDIGTTKWRYQNFCVKVLTEDEEQRIFEEWIAYMRTVAGPEAGALEPEKVRVFHWGAVEGSLHNKARATAEVRCKTGLGWPVIPWVDLYRHVFDAQPVVVRGAFGFGIKDVAKAMKTLGYIQTTWEEGPEDGQGALAGAWWCNAEAKKTGTPMHALLLMTEIAKYNEVDCKVMMEILEYLRGNR